MTLAREVRAIRDSVGLSSLRHVRHFRLEGYGAYDAADRVFTRELYIRDGQISHGLLLNDDATLFGDCYLGSDDEDFFLLAEGPSTSGLENYLESRIGDVNEVQLVDRTEDHAIIGIDGPYSWELLALLVGPEVIGLPYLTFFRWQEMICYRAGKTGEYGYRIIVPKERHEELERTLMELGDRLDVAEVGLAALDQCALDNWFLNIRREGGRPVTPIELQQQWRVSYQKPFVGSDALGRRRAKGVRQRLTCITSAEKIEVDDAVRHGDREIGPVVNAEFSPIREDWVGLALIETAYAHPEVAPLRIGDGESLGRTVGPPVLQNRSLYVNPQIHSYASRADDDFPPIHDR